MQQLLVVGRLFPDILSGAKTHTIRWRETRVAPGPLKIVNESDPASHVIVEVTRCSDVPLSKAAAVVEKEDTWPDPVMLDGMRRHYPEITLDDTVQVVEFRYTANG